MKYVDEYRDRELVRKLAGMIRGVVTRPWTIMEICGGQTHAIMRYGLEEYLPPGLTLVHGPGCPVCVTPVEIIDQAIELVLHHKVILVSFGDMLRVPGSGTDLLGARAAGGDVRMVYSPLDAVDIAVENPGRKVVFFAIGFETTAPANALAVKTAAARNLKNFSVLTANMLVPPAMRLILSSPGNRIQAFLAAGHVCTIMGYDDYIPVAEEYNIPVVVTGFEPVDILQGILMAVRQLEEGRYEVENAYRRAVAREGNRSAKAMMNEVFEVTDRQWRGIGNIAASGLKLRPAYRAYDAGQVFHLAVPAVEKRSVCIAGEVLQGKTRPYDCAVFGKECTPDHPMGAPMVSTEGTCAAYYRYKKH